MGSPKFLPQRARPMADRSRVRASCSRGISFVAQDGIATHSIPERAGYMSYLAAARSKVYPLSITYAISDGGERVFPSGQRLRPSGSEQRGSLWLVQRCGSSSKADGHSCPYGSAIRPYRSAIRPYGPCCGICNALQDYARWLGAELGDRGGGGALPMEDLGSLLCRH